MIYVDAIQHDPDCTLPYKDDWCHMATGARLAEVHQMAARLGLRRACFQSMPTHPHDDLTPAKRALTLRPGAQAASTHERIRRYYPETPGKGFPSHGAEVQR